ncbi:MAG: UDP-glucose/GDP-mannose dehydrogenase family protein [Alphaproteobacteria bacterium]|nr:UDP-glucose/GDP-mannose dehydrogenase family protein [Alphaproteobacteria bacterium]
MKLAIIGTGYVGLPTGTGFAELGFDVVCADKDKNKIDKLNQGELTLFEEGLKEIFIRNLKSNRLKFTTDIKNAVKGADVVMLAVGTPQHAITKEADLSYIYAAAEELAPHLEGYTVIATKSTVPVGTGDEIEKIIRTANQTADFDTVSIPEFLREGFAIYDFFHPDRIVIGTNSDKARKVMEELYQPFADKTTILWMNRRSAETVKYASNAFLAMKIHYINEMADFCEKSGADINEVAKGMGLDSRIGRKFLNAGPGYGGSCFPKDTNAMAQMGKKWGAELNLIETVIAKNDERKAKMAQRVIYALKGNTSGKIAVLGLAFKGGTDDCRESPAIEIVQEMLKYSSNICVYDPKAQENAAMILKNRVQYASGIKEACENASAVVILTEWAEFGNIDLTNLKKIMTTPCIIDLRNMLDKNKALSEGFEYQCIGFANV